MSHSLKDIAVWQNEKGTLLEQLWITTAEQLIGMSHSPVTLHNLADYLNLSLDDLKQLIEETRTAIDKDTLQTLEKPDNSRKFSLGALKPNKS